MILAYESFYFLFTDSISLSTDLEIIKDGDPFAGIEKILLLD